MRTWNRVSIAILFLIVPMTARADWEGVAAQLIDTEKPGYGGLSGVAVDRRTGDVFIFLSNKGLYRSTDLGKTWIKPKKALQGRTETPGCIEFDPDGKRISLALVYGTPLAISADLGESWNIAKASHIDWCTVDWTDPQTKFMLTLKHESGGTLLVSRDGGTTFTEVGKDFGPAYIFDGETAIASEAKSKTKPNPRLLRTVDGGKTFEPVADYLARAVPRFFKGTLYWLTESALISSSDKGKTWKKISDVKNGRCGPVFGKRAEHMFVLTTDGIIESTDGGAAWAKPIALPKEMKGINYMTWLDYDPIHDVLYTTKMSADLYKLKRNE
jgi:photosystem II stability/assembly factor-like uncharacterized protein